MYICHENAACRYRLGVYHVPTGAVSPEAQGSEAGLVQGSGGVFDDMDTCCKHADLFLAHAAGTRSQAYTSNEGPATPLRRASCPNYGTLRSPVEASKPPKVFALLAPVQLLGSKAVLHQSAASTPLLCSRAKLAIENRCCACQAWNAWVSLVQRGMLTEADHELTLAGMAGI